MRKIVLTEWVSLDGFTAGPNNDMSYVGDSFDADMGEYESTILNTGDTLLLGRLTYESFAGSWPHVPDDPTRSEPEKDYARSLNAMRKIVVSSSLASADWSGSEIIRSLDPAYLQQLKRQDGKNILIYGSASIVQQLTGLGLIDEYQILVHPIVLGGGKALFANVTEAKRLELVSSRQFASGVMLLTYRPRA
ncbi:MAG: dihydrofolate reductase [Chloroflexi bacterium]|nr:dihydrofolate reductase [Chloroflexota bacterium]